MFADLITSRMTASSGGLGDRHQFERINRKVILCQGVILEELLPFQSASGQSNFLLYGFFSFIWAVVVRE